MGDTLSAKPQLTFTDQITVEVLDCTFSDERVCLAAWTSTKGREADLANPDRTKGLINALMRDRHGCYDSQTEVLTAEGWKRWPDVDGTERFVTLNIDTDEIELQRAERLVVKSVNEHLVRIQMAQVDAFVTEDHNMFAAPRQHGPDEYQLVKARDFTQRSHRIRMGGGEWNGDIHDPETAALIGFAAADGNYNFSNTNSRQVEFHLSKPRKTDWLIQNYDAIQRRADRYVVNLSPEAVEWVKSTYTADGDRCLPRELLQRGDAETLQALLDGYLMGDGNVSPTGTIRASTVSQQMVDDLQELALKVGMAAVQGASDVTRSGAYGTRPVHRITFYRDRWTEPRVGWTTEARRQQVSLVGYLGNVYCVTVPNGTLYVRRNGKPMWCGNTPFEHMNATFRVTAPIFVWREHHRHRVGFSYSEESGRYKQLDPVFYVPGPERHLQQVPGSRQMEYKTQPGTRPQQHLMRGAVEALCEEAYLTYLELLENGIIREMARIVLPVNIMSTCIVSCNARSLMHFLSLRQRHDDAKFPSKPMTEINLVADGYELLLKDAAPLVHEAFVAQGRVAP